MSLPAPPLKVSTAPSSGCPAMPSQSVMVSSPVPPIRTSWPLRPSRASLPPSPRTTSSPFVPSRSSELLVPVISSRWAAYAEPAVPTRLATASRAAAVVRRVRMPRAYCRTHRHLLDQRLRASAPALGGRDEVEGAVAGVDLLGTSDLLLLVLHQLQPL